jgi:nitrogen fixation NifU-like protein
MYQEVIIDHDRHPHKFRRLENMTRTAEGVTPLCGDELTVYLVLTDGCITDTAFQGSGCASSQASASLMTKALTGKSEEEALALFADVHSLLTERSDGDVDLARLGSLAALSGVSEFPMRVKCSTLAWHALRSALEVDGARITRG